MNRSPTDIGLVEISPSFSPKGETIMSTSPSDRMFDRMDQGAFACVPRDLAEAYREAKEGGDWTSQQDAAREIAEAALDDIS